MSLEYLAGYGDYNGQAWVADIWVLRDEDGKMLAFTMKLEFHK